MLNSVRTVLDRPGWAVGMDLAYDFVSDRKFGPALPPSDTHAQTIYAPNAVGLYLPFTANVLTRTDLGLQTVPTRTNRCLEDSTFATSPWVGTGAGTGSVPTVTNNFGVAPDGTTTAARGQFALNGGTASGDQSSWRQASTSLTNAVTYTHSIWLKSNTASTYVMQIIDSEGVVKTNITVTPTWQQFSISRLQTSTSGSWGIWLRGSAGNSDSADVLMWADIVAQGTFNPGGRIATTVSSATVNGNQQVISLPTQLAAGVAGVVQFNGLAALVAGDFGRVFTITAGGADNTNAFRIYRDGATRYLAELWTGSVQQAGVVITGGALSGLQTLAFAYGLNYVNARFVGQATSTADTSASLPALSQANIGGDGISGANNNYQFTRKLALKFGAQDAGTFAQMYDRAQLMAAS